MCQNCINLDQVKADTFAESLVELINHGSTALLISLGHRTGLFDTMDQLGPATSEEIAEKAELNERYVREWLSGMTVAKIVEIDPEGPKFKLPAEHAAFLTSKAGAENIGVFTQYMAVLGSVEDRIVECFHNGGGVEYDEYKRFHQVMADDSGQSIISSLFDYVLPLVPDIQSKMEAGIDVLDIGCGSGKALNQMAQKFSKSNFTGYDLCLPPLEAARQEAEKWGLKNVKFEQRDLTYFEADKRFDFITAFDAIHDQARPDVVLKGIYDSLKPGGYFLMQDIDASTKVENNMDHPLGPLLYTLSTMHCMTVSLAQNGMGLGAMWGREKAQEMLQEAGFEKIEIKRLKHDVQNCFYVIQK